MSPRFKKYRKIRKKIDGWCKVEAAAIWDCLLDAQRATGVEGHMLEVGVWHGKTAVLLAMHRGEQESLLLLDKYLQRPAVEASLSLAGHPENSYLHVIEGDSFGFDASPWVPSPAGTFRYVHIDGEHSGRAILNDLSVADGLLGDDGIVCLDDFFKTEYPQITQATFAWIADHPDALQLFLVGCSKAYLARPAFVDRYLRYCRDDLVDDLADRGLTMTVWKTTDPSDMNCFGITNRSKGIPARRGPDWDQDKIEI